MTMARRRILSIRHPELTPEEAEQARKRYLLRRFWISARGYWGRGGDRPAWLCSIGLLSAICINVGFQYGINVWNCAIFDAIEQRNASTVYFLSAVFVPLVLGSGSLVVAQVFLRMTILAPLVFLGSRPQLSRDGSQTARYYQLNLVGGDHTEPRSPHRRKDLRIATELPVDFIAGVISPHFCRPRPSSSSYGRSAGHFTLTICRCDSSLFQVFSLSLRLFYAAITSTSMAAIGRNFVHLSEEKNQAEAEFRYTLTRVRENGESIALLGGEEEERRGIDKTFGQCARGDGRFLQASTCAQRWCRRGRAYLRRSYRFCSAPRNFLRVA